MSDPNDSLFALADTGTVEAFQLAGEVRRRVGRALFRRDAAGDPWLGLAGHRVRVGVAGAGAGLIYHPAAPAERVAPLRLPRTGDDPVREEIEAVLDGLRFGPLTGRLLWAVHVGVIARRTSAPEFGYADLAARVWGRGRSVWPRHWRRTLRELLVSLTCVHRADGGPEDRPGFGPDTVLVYQVTIDGERLTDPTGRDTRRDARIQVFAGPALLGCLERLAKADRPGVRTYDSLRSVRALRAVGRTGKLQRVFLPALLPERGGLELTPDRGRLLQALIRETTRARPVGRTRPAAGSEPEVLPGGVVRAYSGRGVVRCPALRGAAGYVGFNGNGGRHGMGYRPTPQGWLSRSGYAAGGAAAFLADLRGLADDLGLVVVGVTREGVVGLDTLAAWASAGVSTGTLAGADVRVFAAETYEAEWAARFGWPAAPVPDPAAPDRQRLVELVAGTGLSRRAVARRLGLDHSFLGRVLAGKKPCPVGLPERVESLAATERSAGVQPVAGRAGARRRR